MALSHSYATTFVAGPLELLLSLPRWLCKDWPAVWDSDQRAGYDAKFKKFVGILQEEEMKIVKSGPPIMSNLMEESWNRSGKFEYPQLLGEVFLFDEDWLWERLEADYASEVQNPLDDTSIIEGKLVDYKGYLAMSRPMRVFDYIGSKSSANCSYCWACLHPGWMDHDIRDCVQAPRDDSTVSVMEAAAACRSNFAYPTLPISVDRIFSIRRSNWQGEPSPSRSSENFLQTLQCRHGEHKARRTNNSHG